MKFVLVACMAVLMIIIGCGQKGEKKTGAKEPEKQAVWDGTPPAEEAIPDFFADAPEINAFPDSIVGFWNGELPGIEWSVELEPDGSIKKIHHNLADDVNIEEGGVEVNGPDDSYAIFSMGPCEARYVPKTRVLKVKIIVNYFLFKLPEGEVEGRMEDYFEGPISEDGLMWDTQWRGFGWVIGSALPDINLIKANPESLIFVKIDPNNPPEELPLQ